jgi:hypothetical protein
MTTADREQIIERWPYPWAELLDHYRQFRDVKLKSPDRDEVDKQQIRDEYEHRVEKLFSRGS